MVHEEQQPQNIVDIIRQLNHNLAPYLELNINKHLNERRKQK